MMPWQLARSNRRHDRHSEPRAIIERTPHINISDLIRQRVFPDNYYDEHILEMPFKYPWAKSLVISRRNIVFAHRIEYNQRVGIHWAKTGFGKPRPLFICSQCCRGAQRLFFKYGSLACQECHKLSYASRQRDYNGRKRLSAAKLRLQLGSLSDITEPLPAKPKWQHHKTYQRIRTQIITLEAKAKAQQFKKPIDTRLFAHHIA